MISSLKYKWANPGHGLVPLPVPIPMVLNPYPYPYPYPYPWLRTHTSTRTHTTCLLRGHNWVHFAHMAIMYCYLEFKLRYLKNLQLFSIRVKELFQPIVLRKKKGRRVFALFITFLLRNRSLSNARWFYVKKRNIQKGNLYLTENRLERYEIWFAEDNHSCMCHIREKGFFCFVLFVCLFVFVSVFVFLFEL